MKTAFLISYVLMGHTGGFLTAFHRRHINKSHPVESSEDILLILRLSTLVLLVDGEPYGWCQGGLGNVYKQK